MSDEIGEEYDRLVRPELYAAMERNFFAAMADLKLPPLEVAVTRHRAMVRRRLERYDRSILEAIGLSLDDLLSARETKLAKRHAGERLAMAPANVAQRRTALLAIHQADQSGLGWSETIVAVQAATMQKHGREHDRKTLDSWLRCLHGWGLISIQPPGERGRGRPRKKE